MEITKICRKLNDSAISMAMSRSWCPACSSSGQPVTIFGAARSRSSSSRIRAWRQLNNCRSCCASEMHCLTPPTCSFSFDLSRFFSPPLSNGILRVRRVRLPRISFFIPLNTEIHCDAPGTRCYGRIALKQTASTNRRLTATGNQTTSSADAKMVRRAMPDAGRLYRSAASPHFPGEQSCNSAARCAGEVPASSISIYQ